MIGGIVRKLLGIRVTDTEELRKSAKQERQLARLARAERTTKIFETLISEVRK